MSERTRIRFTVAALLLFIIILLLGLSWRVQQTPALNVDELQNYGAVLFDTPRTIRPLALQLEDQGDVPADFLRGKWSVLFYGFTRCPDICPTTLAELAKVEASLLGAGMESQWQVVLVAIDSERDPPEKLRPYLDHFSKNFRAIGGGFNELLQLAQDTNAAFGKVGLPDGQYTMDHSSQLVLINPRGDYAGFIKGPVQAERVAPVIQSLIAEFNRRYGG